MDRRRRVAPECLLDDDPLRPREPVGHLGGQDVVTGDQADGNAPGTERDRVDRGLAGRTPVERRADDLEGVGVGDRPEQVPGPGVIAHEQRHAEAAIGPGAGDHRPGLLALEEDRPWVEPGLVQVVHAAMAVVDEHLGRAAGEGSVDRGVRLTGHQLDGRRVALVLATRRVVVADPGDPLHVDADVDLHDPSSVGSAAVRAGAPTQMWPSVNRSAFQIGARAFVSSIA